MTVKEFMTLADMEEIRNWAAYERIRGPLGQVRHDFQAGVIASTIANVNRGRGARLKAAQDFMLKMKHDLPQTPQDHAAIMNQWVAATAHLAGKPDGTHSS